jgi:hypothetical protein
MGLDGFFNEELNHGDIITKSASILDIMAFFGVEFWSMSLEDRGRKIKIFTIFTK